MRERIEGVDVLRVWSIPASTNSILLRAIASLSFAFAATLAGLFLARRDLVITRIPSFGTELAGLLIARLKGSKLLLEFEDVPPDNLLLVGLQPGSVFYRAIAAYYRRIYQFADLVTVIGLNPAAVLQSRGVPPSHIVLWPCAADGKVQGLVDSSSASQEQHQLPLVPRALLHVGSIELFGYPTPGPDFSHLDEPAGLQREHVVTNPCRRLSHSPRQIR